MRVLLFLVAALVLFGSGCTGESASTDTAEAVEAATVELGESPLENGQQTFETYCSGCHGEDATGNGPIVEDLTVAPPNLRLLSQENGGAFPAEDVYSYVDGREAYAEHGTREMPIWGNIWIEEDGQPRPEESVVKEISEVVEYLRSIQD